MHRRYFYGLVVASVASAILVMMTMWREAHKSVPVPTINLVQRPSAPFNSYISAVGIVEASSENIFIGTPVNRVVDKVEVQVGEKVKAGQVLFRLECRDLEAQLHAHNVAYANAEAQLLKLQSLPRREDLAASEALLKGAEIDLAQAKGLYENVQGAQSNGALSKEEVNRRKYNYELAQAKADQVRADLDKTKAGAWKPDLEIARLEVLQARAEVQRTEAEIARTIVKSPIDGTVLQIKIHPGEFPPSDSSRTPPMIIGDTDKLNLRVSINQFDASYYRASAQAVAFLQGNAQVKFPLHFVRLEPYFVTKQNLTNDISEKVDTRVLQVIYCFNEADARIFVGQQMDVFIQTDYSPLE